MKEQLNKIFASEKFRQRRRNTCVENGLNKHARGHILVAQLCRKGNKSSTSLVQKKEFGDLDEHAL